MAESTLEAAILTVMPLTERVLCYDGAGLFPDFRAVD
jgi:hypothetical protein